MSVQPFLSSASKQDRSVPTRNHTRPIVKQLHVSKLDNHGETRIVDVRNRTEFEGPYGHLEGAVLAPLSQLESQAQDWGRDEPLLVVCQSGMRSALGCSTLIAMGFTDVTNLAGGMMAAHAHRNAS